MKKTIFLKKEQRNSSGCDSKSGITCYFYDKKSSNGEMKCKELNKSGQHKYVCCEVVDGRIVDSVYLEKKM